MVNSFRNQLELADKSDKTAIYYLMEANWDMKEAIRLYREDLAFEKNNPILEPQNPVLAQIKRSLNKTI